MQAIERITSILDYVSESNGASLAELVKSLGISKTALHRISSELAVAGMLQKDDDGRFLLGPRILAWADRFDWQQGLSLGARRYLEQIHRQTGETVHLFCYQHGTAYYLDKIESDHPVSMRSRIGSSQPLYSTGGGKAILAFLPPEERAEYFASNKLEPRTPNTVTDSAALTKSLEQGKTRGYFIEIGENEREIGCVAVPILNAASYPLGAISIAAPLYRSGDAERSKWGALLMEIRHQLEQDLWKGGRNG